MFDNTDEENNLSTHERLKAADKRVRHANDDLESTWINFREDPTDRNREKIADAKRAVFVAIEERDELLDQFSEDDLSIEDESLF